jgi:hypothetical protein
MKKLLLAFTAISILFLTATGYADCISCVSGSGSSLVCTGDSTFDAIQICGNPDYSESRDEITSVGNTISTDQIETFYYNCGEGTFTRELIFINGKLRLIKDGAKGSGPKKCW